MICRIALVVACLIALSPPPARAGEPQRKLKAVMYVGGCCHDYKTMPGELARHIQELASVSIEIRHVDKPEDMVAEFKSPTFGDAFDVIIYDICFGENWQDGDYDAALKTADAGKPAVFVHCSAHTYRPPRNAKDPKLAEHEQIADQKWHALVGMDSRVHDKYAAFATLKAARQHPILRTFPDDWKTEGDELYNTVKMMPTATPLLTAKSPASGKVHVVAWINRFGKARVFGTTLGHDMKTGADPSYHKLLAYGLLWACDKLAPDGTPAPGYGGGR